MMTVRELQNQLAKYPPDTIVETTCICGDFLNTAIQTYDDDPTRIVIGCATCFNRDAENTGEETDVTY